MLIADSELRDLSLPGSGSLIVTSISVTQLSSLSLTISSGSGSTSAITLAAYLKRGGRPSFADFSQVKVISQFGGVVMFDQIDSGEWFLLIYNGGEDLANVNIDITVRGKLPIEQYSNFLELSSLYKKVLNI